MEYPDPSSFVSASHLDILGGDIELEKNVVLGGGSMIRSTFLISTVTLTVTLGNLTAR